MTTATRPRPLLDDRLTDMLRLIKGADSVELKLTVPENSQLSAVRALRMDPLEGQIRQVFFFDTPDLALDRAGVVVRARRVQGRGDDSVVKLRPVEPDRLPAELRRSAAFGVEVDAMPGGYVCSASFKGVPAKAMVREAAGGASPLRKLFSKEQRAFYREHAPEGIGLDDLSVLGPIFVLKLKLAPKEFDRKLVAELWLYPNGSRILELSTKCAPAEALQVATSAKALLSEAGIDLTGAQQTKTRTALRYFARSLQAEDRPAAPAGGRRAAKR
jgi:hypothetical protein